MKMFKSWIRMNGMQLAAALVGAAALAGAGTATAQEYPNRPISLIVGFAAGGATDAVARVIGQAMSTRLNVPVVIDNKPGAAGIPAIQTLRGAPLDGYTLLLGSGGMLSQGPGFRRDLPYDPLVDFVPVSGVAKVSGVLVARSELPVTNVRELVAYAKANPGNTTYSSSGVGTANQLSIELLAYKTGTKFLHIPYKSDTQSASEIMAGRVDFSIMTASVAIPLVQSGKLKAFAVTSPKRIAAIPNVPSLMEAGLPGLDALEPFTFYGIVGAAGLPPAVVRRLNAAVSEALADPAVVARFATLGFDPTPPAAPEQFGAFMRSELMKWRDLSANVKIDFK